MKQKCIIWGTGKVGSTPILKEIIESKYEVVAYCDSNQNQVGKKLNGLDIISSNNVKVLVEEKQVQSIIIGVTYHTWIESITTFIQENISKDIEIARLDEFMMSELEKKYLATKYNKLQYKWNVDFSKQSAIWIKNLMSEVEYWAKSIAHNNAKYMKSYAENTLFTKFDEAYQDFEKQLKENDVVMDIGSGVISKYGNILENGSRIQVIAVDPLAHFYNVLFSERRTADQECRFGMFEFIANFYEQNSCDAIIINNALDHCIDPYKSIIECLYILKEQGKMRTVHRKAEAVYEKYSGLHKWNIDCNNNNNNFIIWNEENAVNVSECLKDIVDIHVSYSGGNDLRVNQMITIEFTKKRSFLLEEFINLDRERKELANTIEQLIKYYASVDTNKVFSDIFSAL